MGSVSKENKRALNGEPNSEICNKPISEPNNLTKGKLKEVLGEYKDLIPYGICGALTTAINIFSYWLLAHIIKLGVMPSTVLAWLIAVSFAFASNRKWVFHSNKTATKDIAIEGAKFFACRITTGLMDITCMYIFVELLTFNDMIIKTIANFLVILLNYLGSKYVVFRK